MPSASSEYRSRPSKASSRSLRASHAASSRFASPGLRQFSSVLISFIGQSSSMRPQQADERAVDQMAGHAANQHPQQQKNDVDQEELLSQPGDPRMTHMDAEFEIPDHL